MISTSRAKGGDGAATDRVMPDHEGLTQLGRYLGRCWRRAGLPVGQDEDHIQAAFEVLLGRLGRSCFDGWVARVGREGLRRVLDCPRAAVESAEFFRAIDRIRKRSRRHRHPDPMDAATEASLAARPACSAMGMVREALVSANLSGREAELLGRTLAGESPLEIARGWGVAAKTVSNQKTAALRKLRNAMS